MSSNPNLNWKGLDQWMVRSETVQPSTSAPSSYKSPTQLYEQANASYGKKEYDQAIREYTSVLALEPQHSGALLKRAEAYINSFQSEPAMEDIAKFISIHSGSPDLVKAYLMRGKMHHGSDESQAISDFSEALRLYSPVPHEGPQYCGEYLDHPTCLHNLYMWRGFARSAFGDRRGACLDYSRSADNGSKFVSKILLGDNPDENPCI